MSDIETWAVLASGPSMSQEVADSVRGLRVIAVSNTYELAPWAEIRVSNDRTWWVNNPKALDFEGEKFCGLCIETPKTVTKFPGAISGGNSGLLALQVAVSKGAKRILLFGVDLCGSHYFGDHPSPLRNPSEKRFETFQKQFAFFKPAGVEIINCSPESKLRAYPFGNAKELIPQPAPEPEPAPLPEKGEMGPPGPMGPQGERGPRGPQGEQGPIGPMPDHQWQGTSLRFEEPDGGWGPYVDLRGPAGAQGYPGGGGGGGQGMTAEERLKLETLLNIFGGWISTVPVAEIDEVVIDNLEVSVEGSATGFYPTYPPAPAGFVGQAWEWDWGDGSSVSTTQNASHTYAEDGTYTISFRAKNHIGWSAPVTEEVTVSASTGGDPFWPDVFALLNGGAITNERPGGPSITVHTGTPSVADGWTVLVDAGAGESLELAANPAGVGYTGPVTFEFRVEVPTVTTGFVHVFISNIAEQNGTWEIYWAEDGKFSISSWTGNIVYTDTTVYSGGDIVELALSFDGVDTYKFWINGTKVYQTTDIPPDWTVPLRIGQRPNFGDRWFSGRMNLEFTAADRGFADSYTPRPWPRETS